MCYVIIRHWWDEDYGADGAFFDKAICAFDDDERAEEFLKSKGLKPDVNNEYESKYCRGKAKIPDVYYIKEIPYNDDNYEGSYENHGQTWIPFND